MMEEISLTPKQKQAILDMWNNSPKDDAPPLLALIQKAAGFEDKDGRSKEGKVEKVHHIKIDFRVE